MSRLRWFYGDCRAEHKLTGESLDLWWNNSVKLVAGEIMKSEMKNQLLRALIRELKMYTSWEPRLGRVWLNGSIDMIQVQGFQYDPVYYQLLEPLSTGVQQRFSHTFGKYFILFWRHHGALWSTDCHPPGGHSSLSTTPSYPTPAQVSPWKMNERLQWKLLADT